MVPEDRTIFFYDFQYPFRQQKKLRSPLLSPTSRSIHLFFDLRADLGDISLSGEGGTGGVNLQILLKKSI